MEALQELPARGKRPMTCAASSAVNSAVAGGAEEDIRQMAVSLKKFVRFILIMLWFECIREITGRFGMREDGGEYKVGGKKEQSINSSST